MSHRKGQLIAIGGAEQEESFEIQAKVRIHDRSAVLKALQKPEIEIVRKRHYRQYDTYFNFEDREQGRLRFREDDFVDDKDKITNVRARLTLVGLRAESRFPQDVLLSRSRYLAPASQTLRFYREYFKPQAETEIEKDRRRYLVRYQNIEFFINIDHVTKPDRGYFIEVKSRTNRRYGEPKEAVTPFKQQHIRYTAKAFACSRHIEGRRIRFDVVEVMQMADGTVKFHHIRNAF